MYSCTEDICNTEQCGPAAPVLCLEGKAIGGCNVSGGWDNTPDCISWCDTSKCKRTGNPCSKETCNTHQCSVTNPVLCLKGPSKDGCATEQYWKERQSCTEWCDTSKCRAPGPAPGPRPGPRPGPAPGPRPKTSCEQLKERVDPKFVRWRSTENCLRMRKQLAPDLEGECPQYCYCHSDDSKYPSDFENPNDNSCLFRNGGWGSCCDLTDNPDGPDAANWRLATNVKGADCFADGFGNLGRKCVINPDRDLWHPARWNGILNGCGNRINARECLEYEYGNDKNGPCKTYGASDPGPKPERGEYCFQDYIHGVNDEEEIKKLYHTFGFEHETEGCPSGWSYDLHKTPVKHMFGWQWCRPNKNTNNRVCLSKRPHQAGFGVCVDVENIGTYDDSFESCENGNCVFPGATCDHSTKKCIKYMTAPNHNFKWNENAHEAGWMNDGDIPWEKCYKNCSSLGQECCD